MKPTTRKVAKKGKKLTMKKRVELAFLLGKLSERISAAPTKPASKTK